MDINEKRRRVKEIYQSLQDQARNAGWVDPSQGSLPTSDHAVYQLNQPGKPRRVVTGFDNLMREGLGSFDARHKDGAWGELKSGTVYQYLSAPGSSHVFILKDKTAIHITRIR